MIDRRRPPQTRYVPAPSDLKAVRRAARQRSQTAERDGVPVDVHAPARLRSPRARTEGGIPKFWGKLKYRDQRDRLREFLAGTAADRQHWVAIDTGLVFPIAARISNPSVQGGDGRHEASVLYSRGALLDQQRTTSRRASLLNETLARQFDFTRTVPNSTSRPLQDLFVVTGLDVFKRMHSIYDGRALRSRVERTAEVRRVVSELVDLCVGGKERWSAQSLRSHKFIVVVGDGPDLGKGKKVGAVTANVILRQIPVEMRRRGLDFRIVAVPEYMTSQKCPRPRCVDASGCRSR